MTTPTPTPVPAPRLCVCGADPIKACRSTAGFCHHLVEHPETGRALRTAPKAFPAPSGEAS